MTIELQQNVDKQISLFGLSKQDMIEQYKSETGSKNLEDVFELASYAQCIISDAQHQIDIGNKLLARQFMNKAKWFMQKVKQEARKNW